MKFLTRKEENLKNITTTNSNMTKKGPIDDNDILEIKFLDKKINRTIAFVFGGLILIVVIASALSSWSYDVSKGKS